MNIDPQTILDKLNQLPIHLQQEALNYIDFLITKYGIPSPPPIEKLEETSEKASTGSTASEENSEETPIESTASEEPPTDNKVEAISEEDAKLDEEIAKIEEKNKRRITADWQELKSDFLNEFNR